ncbi:MAG: type II toxin-antitoxin system RelE/ParE family toxin [Pyrinomonadaceae bacterium]
MAQIRWTPQAADDLDAIADFIALDSSPYANLFVLNVITSIDRLEQFPMLGRVVPEYQNPQIRELLMGNYRIIYRLKEDFVEILTTYQGARLLLIG